MGELTEFLLSLKEPHEILKERGLPVYLYGTGDGADKISAYLEEKGVKIRGVFASDGFVRDREYRGYRVRSLGEVEKEEGVTAAVQCFG
ncbi:MAG: FkbM family methyltransferase, partial [Clostridiales bacterium]|nr:FkbM family methyltransferase [Candidatus Coliplasma caballi]